MQSFEQYAGAEHLAKLLSLATNPEGYADECLSAIDALQTAAPEGAPAYERMRLGIIEEMEPAPIESYAGAGGLFVLGFDSEDEVHIRSLLDSTDDPNRRTN